MYLFDSNALKLFVAGDANTVRRVSENPTSLWLSSVAAEELLVGQMNGINRARSPRTSLSLAQAHRNFAQALEDIRLLPLLVYSDEAEQVFQSFPASIKRIGPQDCRIAAQAIAHGLIVVTRNLRDFTAIGAPCEDWSV
jgi:predicted nucleic acid-binding protein